MMNRLPVATQDHAKMRQINSEGALSRLAAALIALQVSLNGRFAPIHFSLRSKANKRRQCRSIRISKRRFAVLLILWVLTASSLKYGSTSFLLNAQANVLLQKTPNPDFAGAQVLLRDALRLVHWLKLSIFLSFYYTQNPNNFDVVATLLICLEHMMNPDDATQIDYLRKSVWFFLCFL